MFPLHNLLKVHKKTVFFGENGFSTKCILKPPGIKDGFEISGFVNFTGITIDESGFGNFGDTFELTINLDELKEKTEEIPVKNWMVDVYFPMIDKWKDFKIENAPLDRTLGMALLRCTASTGQGQGKRIDRTKTGGL